MNYELAIRAGTGILEIWLQSLVCITLQGRPDAGSLEGGGPIKLGWGAQRRMKRWVWLGNSSRGGDQQERKGIK